MAFIDDDEISIHIGKYYVIKSGMVDRVIEFQNGLEAINYIEENKRNIELLPDIILLDLNMPIMDGFMFLEEYLKIEMFIRKSIRIFVVSSSINEIEISQLLQNICVYDFVPKPLNANKINQIIEQSLLEELSGKSSQNNQTYEIL